MSHLSFETIARLVDEQPSALDNAHLTGCAACRAELEAMRADVAALGDLPDLEPSPAAWSAIEARLEAEGLLTAPKHNRFQGHTNARTNARTYAGLARAAAIAAIFAGGALVGHAVGGTQRDDGTQVATATDAGTPSGTDSSLATSPDAAVSQGATVTAADVPAPAAQRPVRLASTGNAQRNAQRSNDPTDGDAALRSLRDAENKYFSELSKYSQKTGTETSDPTARLAALEGIVLTTRAALAQAPTDPVINGYHLTALAQRDAMLKQIKATPATSW